ncbi:carbohydrate kinase family protein [Candidatus Saccharibacteria bacterium]|nr:carbohydrate kinase family protein [Candidatus Saccharibacteria bacterium]MBI3338081.1 carbohydrate kinase family protein [Candidatus Saccharibacteria bacterium]
MPKIICIGAAVQDVFLRGKIFLPQHEADGDVEEFKLGSKNEVEEVIFSTGGGATNAAVTFARQGFRSYYMGKVGTDIAGTAVLDALSKDQVDTSMTSVVQDTGTGYSVLLLAPSGERTILTYRGASTHYGIQTQDFHNIEPDWIYLSSLDGNFAAMEVIFEYANQHNIKIAMNPGTKELEQADRLRQFLPQLTVLSVNKEEAKTLFSGNTLIDLVKAANAIVPYVIVTDGPSGEAAGDGVKIITGGIYEDVPVIDRTGAGDAFSSGFVAMIASGESLEQAVRFACANSTGVVSAIGAKTGILHKGVQLHDMPLQSENI